jgi:hypothetical protein
MSISVGKRAARRLLKPSPSTRLDHSVALSGSPWDLIETFGPLSAMHAAMDKLGAGMPCGLAVRFVGKTTAEVEGAVAAACRRFPVLHRQLVWLGAHAALAVPDAPFPVPSSQSALSLSFKTDPAKPWWRYRLMADGEDVWLVAVWAHAAADGPSMLRFVQAIGAVMNRASIASLPGPPPDGMPPRSPARWLLRFVFEHHLLRYVRLREGGRPPGVAWLTVPLAPSILLCERARSECGSVSAWLGAAASLAFRKQQGAPAGRVLLNLPVTRDHLEPFGGFGFGSGSLIMSIKPDVSEPLPSVARRIAARQKTMIEQGWDANFARFLSGNPKRHLRFAALHARGLSAPMITVSWKGDGWRFGGKDNIRDIACFAKSTAVHVSSHLDQNGLSVSVTSSQSAAAREDLLRRIVVELGAVATGKVLTLSDHSVETRLHSPAPAPAPKLTIS